MTERCTRSSTRQGRSLPGNGAWSVPGARFAVAGTVMVAMLLSGCSTGSASPAPRPAAKDQLLTAADIGAGWSVEPAGRPSDRACSDPPTTDSLVGVTGSQVRLHGPGGAPTIVEYAVRTTSPETAYVHAIQRIETGSSCSPSTDGHVTSSTFDEVLPLPRLGDERVGMLVTDDAGGASSEAEFALVRSGDDVVVVLVSEGGPSTGPLLDQVASEAVHAARH